MNNVAVLKSYLEALRPIIYINDFDFEAVDDLVRRVADGTPVAEYNNGCGGVHFETKIATSLSSSDADTGRDSAAKLRQFLSDFSTDMDERQIILLKDVHDELSDSTVIGLLKDISQRTMHQEDYWVPIIIASTRLRIPTEIEKYVTVFEIAYPDLDEIFDSLKEYARHYAFDLPDADCRELSFAFKGLSEFEICQILNLAYQQSGRVSISDKDLVLTEKEQSIKKTGLLEAIKVPDSELDIGGLENLVGYLRQKSKVFKNLAEAVQFGVSIPKGILIVGMPGCGKSLTAKACSRLFNAPLIRLDVGRLLGKYVGESEENLRKAIRQAEAATPCVLWIDEIEKAFAGVGKDSDGGLTTRLFGCFLTWMQEKDSTVYVVATANDITGIPPEFLRKGRFDEIFSVTLPDEEERRRIFEIHLRKRHKDWRKLKLDLNALVKETIGENNVASFSGADIESIVKTAVESAFTRRERAREMGDADWQNVDVSQEDLLSAVKNTIPIRKTLADKIEALEKSLQKFQIVSASKGIWQTSPVYQKKAVPIAKAIEGKSPERKNEGGTASGNASHTAVKGSGNRSKEIDGGDMLSAMAGLVGALTLFPGSQAPRDEVICEKCASWSGNSRDACAYCAIDHKWRSGHDKCERFKPLHRCENCRNWAGPDSGYCRHDHDKHNPSDRCIHHLKKLPS